MGDVWGLLRGEGGGGGGRAVAGDLEGKSGGSRSKKGDLGILTHTLISQRMIVKRRRSEESSRNGLGATYSFPSSHFHS